MYLMIHESGNMVLVEDLTSDDLQAADDGIITVIDVSRADKPMRYHDEGWTDIEMVNAQS